MNNTDNRRNSENFTERPPFVIPTKVGIHNELKMLVLDLIGDWILVCTGMTIQTIYGKIQGLIKTG
ncbi:MAG: hypothetical protein Q7J27_02475 [Syntrophales bacterium]|nr:hypothetical protein [Syntrophales bacterium]